MQRSMLRQPKRRSEPSLTRATHARHESGATTEFGLRGFSPYIFARVRFESFAPSGDRSTNRSAERGAQAGRKSHDAIEVLDRGRGEIPTSPLRCVL